MSQGVRGLAFSWLSWSSPPAETPAAADQEKSQEPDQDSPPSTEPPPSSLWMSRASLTSTEPPKEPEKEPPCSTSPGLWISRVSFSSNEKPKDADQAPPPSAFWVSRGSFLAPERPKLPDEAPPSENPRLWVSWAYFSERSHDEEQSSTEMTIKSGSSSSASPPQLSPQLFHSAPFPAAEEKEPALSKSGTLSRIEKEQKALEDRVEKCEQEIERLRSELRKKETYTTSTLAFQLQESDIDQVKNLLGEEGSKSLVLYLQLKSAKARNSGDAQFASLFSQTGNLTVLVQEESLLRFFFSDTTEVKIIPFSSTHPLHRKCIQAFEHHQKKEDLKRELPRLKAALEAFNAKLKPEILEAWQYFSAIPYPFKLVSFPQITVFQYRPADVEVCKAIEFFEKKFITTKLETANDEQGLILINLAFVMGSLCLYDLTSLPSKYPDFATKKPYQIYSDPKCYAAYFLQKAKNMLHIFSSGAMAVSEPLKKRAAVLDQFLFDKAMKYGIILTFNPGLPTSPL